MDDLRERVEAVERALTNGDSDLTALAEGAATAERVDALAADVEALQEDVAELQSTTQALRGYVGQINAVNDAVEERADGALAIAEGLEDRVEALEGDNAGDRGGRQTASTRPRGEPASRPDPTEAAADGVCRTCGRPDATGDAQESGASGEPSLDRSRRQPASRGTDRALERSRRYDRTASPTDGVDRSRSSRAGQAAPRRTGAGGQDGDEAGLLGTIRDRL